MISLTTPALLFPALSLLLLAYTNRFAVLARLIRDLHHGKHEHSKENAQKQLTFLRKRIWLIKYMQASALSSLLLCTLSMLALFFQLTMAGTVIFGSSLVLLCVSLVMALYEVLVSTNAIRVELEEC